MVYPHTKGHARNLLETQPHLKSNKVMKLIPPPSNMFTHAHSKSTQNLFRTPTTP